MQQMQNRTKFRALYSILNEKQQEKSIINRIGNLHLR